MLTACGDDESPTKTPEETSPATLSPVYLHLQQDYERLDTAHTAITTIWEGLAAGEDAQCGDYPDMPAPDSITSEGETAFDDLAGLLRQAAIDTQKAVDLWRAECQNPRTTPSNSVISDGLLAARTAGDALEAAQEILLDSN
jgi:hypothetical protein